ncbi:MAG TPA: 50S ribosomal protein L25 [Ktedonobacteraceae bacterium]
MAQQTELEIRPREVLGKATKRLRKAGIIPANIFGHHEESQAVQIDAVAFDQLVRGHHATSLIALRQPGNSATQTALIRHVQHDPRSGKIIHVDFFRVSLRERVTSKVPLHFVGEAPAVKLEGGVLLRLLDALEVECEAGDLVEFVEVDVTPLTEIDAMIHAGDVKLPAGYTLLTDPKEGVAKVAATRAEIAEEAAEAPAPAAPAAEGEQAGTEA